MLLCCASLENISPDGVFKPAPALLHLPEKVLQFGTGVLLRALPDYFIDKANRQGIFNGRIVVVKSTSKGDASAFLKQDALYTACLRGISNGELVEENTIIAAISRVLQAENEWHEVLRCAYNQQMQVIISNTTELGIELIKENIHAHPPVSYPAKLLAFLYERFKAFGGGAASGMVIIPTELIVDNGNKLKAIILELAQFNYLEEGFMNWHRDHNIFCNSLVDRIVPGAPQPGQADVLKAQLGYSDDLLVIAEPYALWAIEGDASVQQVLTFASCNQEIKIVSDIEQYRELKLRLLNGTHTFGCGPAFLMGTDTVQQAMSNELLNGFITQLLTKEITPAIPYPVAEAQAVEFGSNVLERFQNPHIEHKWISITVQYSLKMKTRCLPLLLQHYKNSNNVPLGFATAFAAYLFFMKPVLLKDGSYYGQLSSEHYPIQDTQAERFYNRWQNCTPQQLVEEVVHDFAFWQQDLSALPGFAPTVLEKLQLIMQGKIREVIENVVAPQNMLT